ncbi:MAG: MlaE family ABC transporter permease [Pseudomonadota bacterium]|jgi:phospholipid/cholesterol/gamma-HCH transport system permease protein
MQSGSGHMQGGQDGPAWRVDAADPGAGAQVRLSGRWQLRTFSGRQPDMAAELARLVAAHPQAAWSLRDVTRLDSLAAVLLWRAWGRRLPDRVDLRPEHRTLFARLAAMSAAPSAPVAPRSEAVRAGVRPLLSHAVELLALSGQVLLDIARVIAQPSRLPWRDLSAAVFRTGTQALPITAMVGFLVGVVFCYLSGRQLQQFGADVFIVNLLGITVVRELGPMLAAILVAGRSGSAITAQIGVMRLNQELDAMTVLGLPHGLRLVLPRVLALLLVMPLLVAWTSVATLAGGVLAAQVELGIAPGQFIERLRATLPILNVGIGLLKGVVFGALVAIVSCHFGLRTRPDTASLGRSVTASVVTSITVVILADAVFAVTFSGMGLRR